LTSALDTTESAVYFLLRFALGESSSSSLSEEDEDDTKFNLTGASAIANALFVTSRTGSKNKRKGEKSFARSPGFVVNLKGFVDAILFFFDFEQKCLGYPTLVLFVLHERRYRFVRMDNVLLPDATGFIVDEIFIFLS
jgi:hypothetical protein